ncbi:50S ribosomal protein L3 N(5)-glutamine methyltransferase [Candidatus Kinetoplastidibacterium crithidiae]|uniref:Putative adenine-specific DNA-methyltransferase n=1 Tax=Candidatus Kinetoplastidibacterium crithidiae TCC036E TaxID=1208918 RepID=M1LTU4_9PROT|nr:50S ribosomal protein L3 N(5)-glutamine methyltransferase [Candidatus Kinetoplastibacterium crithidii]AFZ82821.1 adenine-specific DNA-methyltransferase [Candidatus Kinetoplastibacterium crithidii (ex Angomonas deanei ATCC 30255)]AGF47526.1 putative adenine-specific DNA-methyltransferase [Candidatus Kinetoplastibacterium crithidii TCC036E]
MSINNTNPISKSKPIKELIRYATYCLDKENLFFGHGNDNSLDEAICIISNILGINPDVIDKYLDSTLSSEDFHKFLNILERRTKLYIPTAYLTNEAWLQGYNFYIDERAIIPRSFISEILINGIYPWIKKTENIKDILDLCTGSACLAIISSFIFPNAQILASDISDDALQIAKKNIDSYALQDRIAIKKSNLFEKINNKKYDLIICNPPYVNKISMENLPKEYKHEPEIALYGGSDGMDIINTIINTYNEYLNDNGILLLEIGNEYKNFKQRFPDLYPIWLTTATTENSVLLLQKNIA